MTPADASFCSIAACFLRNFWAKTVSRIGFGVGLLWVAVVWRAEAGEANLFSAALNSITTQELQGYVEVLANDTFEGREAGSRGGHAAGQYLVEQLKKRHLQPGMGKSYFQEFGKNSRNILALLPGGDPLLNDQVIVVSAHYDHVGYGNRSNSNGPIGHIHNGADDNASGVSALLELIDAYVQSGLQPRRTLLFALWDGEEAGLLGSKHWVANPTVPRDRVVFMVNADMLGRLRDNHLYIYGARTGRGLRTLLAQQNRESNLLLDFDWDLKEDSDHYSFYERHIPILMFHTGLHDDYHRPSDDAEKVNVPGIQAISRLMLGVVQELATVDKLTTFRDAARHESQLTRKQLESPLDSPPTRLGMSWDSKDTAGPGVRVVKVVSRSPADRGGLQLDDRVIEFAGHTLKPGDDLRPFVWSAPSPATVVVRRAGVEEPVSLSVPLAGEPLRLGISWREDDATPGSVVLVRVIPGSFADLAGLKLLDRIVEVGGHVFANGREFQSLIQSEQGPLALLVDRDGRLLRIVLDPEATGTRSL